MRHLVCILFFLYFNCSSVDERINSENSITKRFHGEGTAVIFNNDMKSAKKEALSDAFKEVIQKGIGVYIKSKSETKDFQLVYSKVLTESEGYISSYDITSEGEESGIYKVKILAEVSNDKLESAFNQRITKFIENNLVGAGSIELTIYDRNMPTVSFHSPINDPTIEMNSIEVKLPVTGWIKPKIYSFGTINTFSLDHLTKSESGYFIPDVISVLENPEVEVRLKNPNNNKIEIKKLTFDKFNNLIIKENGKEIFPSSYQNRFDKFSKNELKNIISYLKEVAKENKK